MTALHWRIALHACRPDPDLTDVLPEEQQTALPIQQGWAVLWHGKMKLEKCKQTKIYLWSAGKQGKGSSKDCWSVKARSAHWGHQACAAPLLQATCPKHHGLLWLLTPGPRCPTPLLWSL